MVDADVDAFSAGNQKELDSVVVNHTFQTLLSTHTDKYNRARLLAAKAAHSGDWLHAVPISSCGLRLNNDAVRVAVGFRLGSELCQPYQCICGASVDTRGSHALSCKRNPGRSQRHHFVNDLIWRSISKAGYPSIKEPQGLLRTDGKRTDLMASHSYHGRTDVAPPGTSQSRTPLQLLT